MNNLNNNQDGAAEDRELLSVCLENRNNLLKEFKTLYLKHKNGVFTFLIRHTNDLHASEDLLQETFIRVYERLTQAADIDNFKAYLFTTARNLCNEYFRKNQRARTALESISMDAPSEKKQFNEDYPEHALEELIHELPPEEKEVFVLKRIDCFDFRTISSICGCSVRTAKTRMKNAVRMLHKNAKLKGLIG